MWVLGLVVFICIVLLAAVVTLAVILGCTIKNYAACKKNLNDKTSEAALCSAKCDAVKEALVSNPTSELALEEIRKVFV